MNSNKAIVDLTAVNGGMSDSTSVFRLKIGGIIAECPVCRNSVFHTIFKLEDSSLLQVCTVCRKETKL